MNGLKNVKIICNKLLILSTILLVWWCANTVLNEESNFDNKNNLESKIESKKESKSKDTTSMLTWDYKLLHNAVDDYNLSWCSLIENKVLKENCIFDIKSNLWKIENIDDCNAFTAKKDDCLDYVNMENLNCDDIINKEDKKLCEDQFYYNKAVEENSKYYCLYIKNEEAIEHCNLRLENENKNFYWTWWKNTWSCSEDVNILMKECEEYDTDCKIQKLKVKFTSQPSLKWKEQVCKSIWKIDENEYDICMDEFYYIKSLQLMEPWVCENITGTNKQDMCYKDAYFKKATENIMPEVCNNVKDPEKQIDCKDRVLLRRISRDNIDDMGVCENIKLNHYKQQCYSIILENM